nr:MAG TPA: DNA polymerase B [Caudoviricetes sp.]
MKQKIYACDFETTVDYDTSKQDSTEVWSACFCEVGTEDAIIMHSISQFMNYWIGVNSQNVLLYFHNLKFDGSFIIDWLYNSSKFNEASEGDIENGSFNFLSKKQMPSFSYSYLISSMGQWYSITIKAKNHIITIKDSLKLMPFSLAEIGKAFKTKHKKLEMDYKGERYAGCNITMEEEEYIKNDVYVLAEALEFMFNQGHNKMTIGSCCMNEYKELFKVSELGIINEWDEIFPSMTEIELDKNVFGSHNADAYLRKSYRGGWCYLVKGKENKIFHNGLTADVNSLYPSMMHSESGNVYPYGKPKFWQGNYIPKEAQGDNKYFFVRFRCRFYLKEGYLPFVQIKGNWLYKPNEMLETSDIYDTDSDSYVKEYIVNGQTYTTKQTLTMTQVDYYRFREFYNVEEFEILDGCWFYAVSGIFDDYINKYKEIKQKSKGAMRTLAKLFLNNLYGKLATSDNASYKVAYVKDDGVIGFKTVESHDKETVYIPCGSAITSASRDFTIRTAQANYYGADKDGFIYADTDSIHCNVSRETLNNVKVHPSNFCCWKIESNWDQAIFVRQKTYIEHITHEDEEPIDTPYYNIKCAGMPKRPKALLALSLAGKQEMTEGDKLIKAENEIERKFINVKRELTDFKVGLKVPSKLRPKRIKGGVLLVDCEYNLR